MLSSHGLPFATKVFIFSLSGASLQHTLLRRAYTHHPGHKVSFYGVRRSVHNVFQSRCMGHRMGHHSDITGEMPRRRADETLSAMYSWQTLE